MHTSTPAFSCPKSTVWPGCYQPTAPQEVIDCTLALGHSSWHKAPEFAWPDAAHDAQLNDYFVFIATNRLEKLAVTLVMVNHLMAEAKP